MQIGIYASTATAPRRKRSRAELKPAGKRRTRTCRPANHQGIAARRFPTFLDFLAFLATKAAGKKPMRIETRGAGRWRPAHGKSQIRRCSMTDGVNCQI